MGQRNHPTDASVDRRGFEADLSLGLRLVDGMLIVDRGTSRMPEFWKAVERYGRVEAQKYWNHFHLGGRSDDLAQQRRWAYELLDAFRQKARDLSPGRILIGEIKDDNFEIEVTFWTHPDEPI